MPGIDKKWLPDPYTIIIALILLLIYQHLGAVDVATKSGRSGLILPSDVVNQTSEKEEGERGGIAVVQTQNTAQHADGGVWNATENSRAGSAANEGTRKPIPEMTNDKSAQQQKVEEELKKRERERILGEGRKEIERKFAEEKRLAEEKASLERKRLEEAAAAAALANVKKPDQHTQSVFENIYAHKNWGADGRGSGTGSSFEATASIRAALERIIRQYNITSMLDVPCGGMLWMPHVIRSVHNFQPTFRYHGVDIVRNLIDSHRAEFKSESAFNFSVADFSSQPLPKGYDLVFSRDALQHLPLHHTFMFLDAVRASGAKYLLVGSYVTEHGHNRNIDVGDYYSINLSEAPFKVSTPIEIVAEPSTPHGEPTKHMLLLNVQTMTWEKEQ